MTCGERSNHARWSCVISSFCEVQKRAELIEENCRKIWSARGSRVTIGVKCASKEWGMRTKICRRARAGEPRVRVHTRCTWTVSEYVPMNRADRTTRPPLRSISRFLRINTLPPWEHAHPVPADEKLRRPCEPTGTTSVRNVFSTSFSDERSVSSRYVNEILLQTWREWKFQEKKRNEKKNISFLVKLQDDDSPDCRHWRSSRYPVFPRKTRWNFKYVNAGIFH